MNYDNTSKQYRERFMQISTASEHETQYYDNSMLYSFFYT